VFEGENMNKKRGKIHENKAFNESLNKNFIEHISKYWYFALFLVFLLFIFGFYFYLTQHFNIGDVVYKKANPDLIGVIRAISFSEAGYLVLWNTGDYELTSFNLIAKIESLPSLNKTPSDSNASQNSMKNITNYTGKSDTSYYSDAQKTKSYREYYNLSQKAEDFQDYYVEKGNGEQVAGLLYKGTSLGIQLSGKECKPSFVCGSWSLCGVDYNLLGLLNTSKDSNISLTGGIQYRYCEDKNKCLVSAIDSRTCNFGEKLVVKEINCNGEQIVFINHNGRVVMRIKEITQNKLNLNINLLEEQECSLYN
jgi:hypothetical protein